jgi:hypothetical protein
LQILGHFILAFQMVTLLIKYGVATIFQTDILLQMATITAPFPVSNTLSNGQMEPSNQNGMAQGMWLVVACC